MWVVAGALKLPDPAGSVRAVRAYDLLPESAVTVVGHGLPVLELVIGLLLLAGLLTRPASVVSALLLVAFIVGIASAWARGLEIECGCFGGGGTKEGASAAYPWEIARDLGLLAAVRLAGVAAADAVRPGQRPVPPHREVRRCRSPLTAPPSAPRRTQALLGPAAQG